MLTNKVMDATIKNRKVPNMFLPIMEVAFAVLLISGIFTQIVIPLFRKTPIFPVLQRHGIEAKVEQAKQEVRIAKLESELAELQEQAKEIRQEKEKV
jgi:hypothetical protein